MEQENKIQNAQSLLEGYKLEIDSIENEIEYLNSLKREVIKQVIKIQGKYKTKGFEIYTLEFILSCVCEALNLQESHVKGHDRHRDLAEARHIFCFIAKDLTSFTLQQIAKFLDNRNHATIIHSIGKCRNYRETDKVFREKFENVYNLVKK